MDIKPLLSAIEAELQRQISRLDVSRTKLFHEMLTYHMGWTGDGAGPEATGKRIRPLMVLLCTAASGGDWESALPAAAAVELVHKPTALATDRLLEIGEELIEKVKAAPGNVLVIGHSDNQPIRSLRFPSNWHLSKERADSVRAGVAPQQLDAAKPGDPPSLDRGEDLVSLIPPLMSGRLDGVWGSRRLSCEQFFRGLLSRPVREPCKDHML